MIILKGENDMAEKSIIVNEAFLKKVAFRVNEIILERFDAEPNLLPEGYEPSEKFKKAMEELIEKLRKKRRLRPIKTILVVAAILVMLFACAMSVTAIRRAVYDFFMSFYDDYAIVSYEVMDDADDAVRIDELTEIETYYEPTYIPEGFKKVDISKQKIKFTIIYSDGIIKCRYTQDLLSTVSVVDTEDNYISKTDINGNEAFYTVENGDHVLLKWCDEVYQYTIMCNSIDMNIKEIIKIAKSLNSVK